MQRANATWRGSIQARKGCHGIEHLSDKACISIGERSSRRRSRFPLLLIALACRLQGARNHRNVPGQNVLNNSLLGPPIIGDSVRRPWEVHAYVRACMRGPTYRTAYCTVTCVRTFGYTAPSMPPPEYSKVSIHSSSKPKMRNTCERPFAANRKACQWRRGPGGGNLIASPRAPRRSSTSGAEENTLQGVWVYAVSSEITSRVA